VASGGYVSAICFLPMKDVTPTNGHRLALGNASGCVVQATTQPRQAFATRSDDAGPHGDVALKLYKGPQKGFGASAVLPDGMSPAAVAEPSLPGWA
jgi:hypothetical protein